MTISNVRTANFIKLLNRIDKSITSVSCIYSNRQFLCRMLKV